MTDVQDDIETIDTTAVLPHIKCCAVDKFFCQAQFHPEAEWEGGEDERCKACEGVADRFMHRQGRPHMHCPFQPMKICWEFKS